MGNEASSPPKEQEQPKNPQRNSNQHPSVTRLNRIISTEHNVVEHEDGTVSCSCGLRVGTRHIHNLHLEGKSLEAVGPFDVSGWPERQFASVPYVANTQRGVVAKGTIGHGAFNSIHLVPEFDDKHVREVLSRVPQITQEVMEAAAAAQNQQVDLERYMHPCSVASLIAVSAPIWMRWDPKPPHELRSFDEKRAGDSEKILFPATGGDLFLFVKSNRADLCFEVSKLVIAALGENVASWDQTLGFGYMGGPYGGKDLTGFIDGTRNPDHLLRAIVDEVVIFPDDDPIPNPAHTGGSYMYAGRFVHDLSKFFKMRTEQKSEVIGREYGVERVHHGYDYRPENPRLGGGDYSEDPPPSRSHVARAFAAMYRQAMPYSERDQQGLYFICFARLLSEIDTAINRMSGHYADDKSHDNLFSITKAVTSQYYYVPSLSELAALPSLVRIEVVNDGKEKEKEGASEKEKEKGQGKEGVEKDIKVYIEYCTNCGYKTLFLERKKVLESLSPRVQVIGNPVMPRLSSFEVTLWDGQILWSKLSQPDGKNNYPEVFGTNEGLAAALREAIGLPEDSLEFTLPAIYKDGGTRMGVW